MGNKKVGFCRADITPPLGMPIVGYFVARKAVGVTDPLFVNTVVFEEDGKKAGMIVIDLLGTYNELATERVREFEKEFGMDEGSLFICSTHTHTGASLDGPVKGFEYFFEYAWTRIKDSLKMAIDDLTPVTEVLSSEIEAPNLTFSRRLKMKDGHYQTWGKIQDPNIESYATPADQTLRLISFRRENAPEVLLVNYQLHPDCIGGDYYSADYPGYLRAELEKMIPGAVSLYLDGCEGQLIGTDYIHGGPFAKATEKNGDPTRAVKFGKCLAAEARKAYEFLKPTEDTAIGYKNAVVNVETCRDDSQLPESRRIVQLHAEGKDDEFSKNRGDMNCKVSHANAIIRLHNEDMYDMDLPITVIGFAGVAFVGVCGEPFSEMGPLVREGSPYTTTCVCCQTNRGLNYYPTAVSYEQGGYETSNSRLKPGALEKLAELSVKTLKEIYKK